MLVTVNGCVPALALEMARRFEAGLAAPAVVLNDNWAGATESAAPGEVSVRETGTVLVDEGAPLVEMVIWLA